MQRRPLPVGFWPGSPIQPQTASATTALSIVLWVAAIFRTGSRGAAGRVRVIRFLAPGRGLWWNDSARRRGEIETMSDLSLSVNCCGRGWPMTFPKRWAGTRLRVSFPECSAWIPSRRISGPISTSPKRAWMSTLPMTNGGQPCDRVTALRSRPKADPRACPCSQRGGG